MNSDITKAILSKTNRISTKPEITPGDHGFSMFNDAGTEVEVSEFIYSLVRVLKPTLMLETGTHKGISSTYIGQAMKDNGKGQLYTCEIFQENINDAQALWRDVGVQQHIICLNRESLKLEFPENTVFDMLFLDSEPQLRFDEFIKFWPMVKPGGFIMIHDLHPNLGHHGQVYYNELDWPYGFFVPKLGSYIKSHEVQTISLPTPRGCTLFQKRADNFEFTNHLLGKL
jgi:predicted O-methyltransferase YrrM